MFLNCKQEGYLAVMAEEIIVLIYLRCIFNYLIIQTSKYFQGKKNVYLYVLKKAA